MGVGTTTPTNKLHISTITNPLRIEGLQSGDVTDRIVSVDAAGVMRTLTVDQIKNQLGILGAFRVTQSGSQTFPNGGGGVAVYNAEAFDENNEFNLVTDIFTASSTGVWQMEFSETLAAIGGSVDLHYISKKVQITVLAGRI